MGEDPKIFGVISLGILKWFAVFFVIAMFVYLTVSGAKLKADAENACHAKGGVSVYAKSGPPYVSPKLRGCIKPDALIHIDDKEGKLDDGSR